MMSKSLRETSQDAQALSTRCRTNAQFGDRDLSTFILEKLRLRPGEQVLDLGCGTGSLTIAFAEQTGSSDSVVGVDLSPESLRVARHEAERRSAAVQFLEHDMDDIRGIFPEDTFDVATATYSLYYASSPDLVLDELKRIIKPTGRLAIVGPYKDNNQGWFEFLSLFMRIPRNIIHNSSTFMESEVIPFATAHFQQYELFDFVNNISVPSIDDLRAYWRANVYYKEQYDGAFEEAANSFFARSETVRFHKRALMVLMREKS